MRDLARAAKILLTLAPDALASLPVCAALGNPHPLAAALRRGFGRLGPAFVKLGQFLSVRPDLVGEVFAAEMAKLRDRATPLDYATVSAIIKKELGLTPEALFADFDREPLASASVGQVHRAVTRGGDILAIKIQRPDAAERLLADLALLRRVAAFFGSLRIISAHGDPAAFVDQLRASAAEETDFRLEGEVCERFRVLCRKEARIKIPRVHWEFTTRRVLATEFIEGWKISDREARQAPGYGELAEIGAAFFFRQVMEFGLFHADLHPANVLVTSDGKIGYVDFGIRGELDGGERHALVRVVAGMLVKEETAVLAALSELGVGIPRDREKAFAAEVGAVLKTAFAATLADTSIAALGKGLMAAVKKHHVRLPHKYALLVKALLTIEGSARTLHATFDMRGAAQSYLVKGYLPGLGIAPLAEGCWRALLFGAALKSEYPCKLSAHPI